MSCVVFENPGVVDVRALTTLGVNVKEGDSPIGFFGTGFKFAVAVCLRHGWPVIVYAGEEIFEFTAKPATIRGKTFQIVHMNDRELGFTTDLGKNWEPWMAYRELYSNAKDEGGDVSCGEIQGWHKAGCSRVVVIGSGFEKVHMSRHEFLIIDKVPLVVIPGVAEVYKGATNDFFYRGIRVGKLPRTIAYTYNSLREIDLTEDRTVKYSYQPNNVVRDSIVQSDNRIHVERSLTAGQQSYEESLDYDSAGDMGDVFDRVMEQLINERVTDCGSNARLWYRKKKLKESPDTREFTPFERKILDRAVEFCEKCGYEVSRYPIECVDDLGAGTLAMALLFERKIILSKQIFAMGTKAVAATLIEEFLHLSAGVIDCSREMQDLLFNRLVMLLEEHVWGEPL